MNVVFLKGHMRLGSSCWVVISDKLTQMAHKALKFADPSLRPTCHHKHAAAKHRQKGKKINK